MPRPTKLNKDVIVRIGQAIKLGMTYEHAAQYIGVAYETFNRWMKEGANAESNTLKCQFYQVVKESEGTAVAACMAKIQKAATDGQWTAAAWILERRYPATYGRRVVQQEISGPGGGPVRVVAEQLTDDELARIALEGVKELEDLTDGTGT